MRSLIAEYIYIGYAYNGDIACLLERSHDMLRNACLDQQIYTKALLGVKN